MKFMSVRQAAETLGVSEKTIRTWIDKRLLPACRSHRTAQSGSRRRTSVDSHFQDEAFYRWVSSLNGNALHHGSVGDGFDREPADLAFSTPFSADGSVRTACL